MKNIVLSFILFMCLLPAVSGYNDIVYSGYIFDAEVNLSVFSPGLSSQVVVKFPSESLQTVTYISGVTFMCGYTGTASGNYHVRVLSWEDSAWQLIGSNYYYVPVSGCNDNYGGMVHLIFDTPIYMSTFDTVPDIGIGISTTSSSAYFGYANRTSHGGASFLFNTGGTMNISYVNGTLVNDTYFNEIVDYTYIKLDGYAGVTPTPTPTPTGSPTVTGTGAGDGTATSTIPGDGVGSIPSYSDYDPSDTGSPYSAIPSDSGFDALLKDNGFCVSGTCTAGDASDYIATYITLFWWLGMGIVLVRFYTLGGKK